MSGIDPGVEDGIKRAADDVESDEHEEEAAKEAEEDYLEPSRWWFASTLFPLLAGTLGPIASGFNICALVYNWRVYVPPGASEIHGEIIKDPAWLIAVNGISLVSALIANMSLLLNMARRVRFSIAQPITIAGFLFAGVLLVCDMAALVSSPTYRIIQPKAQPADNHALSSAFYYAIFGAAIYIMTGSLMGVTVYGANHGYYKKDFQLTSSQRTLMLQTMSFVTYLLLGALVFSKVEGWEYLDAVFWADVTLLTVGLGDFSPSTDLGRGLLFPFAIGGILIVGLVIGSIRTLVLERGKEKLTARMTEKQRESAVDHVNEQKQTIKIGLFAEESFSTHPQTPLAQRRKQEFQVMRRVQDMAENRRRYLALFTSATVALLLWMGGAAVFTATEHRQSWTYFNALYFSYTSLLTIGYGDLVLLSNSGKPFFVLWSLLAVPSLTILISNMGDTIVKWVTELTDWLGAVTVLPGDEGVRHTLRTLLRSLTHSSFSGPGIFGVAPKHEDPETEPRASAAAIDDRLRSRLAERLRAHLEEEELDDMEEAQHRGDELQRDIHFYNYVLSRECRNVQKDLVNSGGSPKKYSWGDWEYYLRLMGNGQDDDDTKSFPGQSIPNALVPDAMRVDRRVSTRDTAVSPDPLAQRVSKTASSDDSSWGQDWSWLSPSSPLMGTQTESQWILEKLSAALERELNRQRRGARKRPPISFAELKRHVRGEVLGGESSRTEDELRAEEREMREGGADEKRDSNR
ncbi:hypothetical protein LTR95_017518 [Oleoguttula sp. CCFEE 5521]